MTLDSPLTPITSLAIRIRGPQWDKAASVQIWLTNALAVAVIIVGETDPGFVWPSWTHSAVPIVAGIIASIAHELILRRAARKAQLAGARAYQALGV